MTSSSLLLDLTWDLVLAVFVVCQFHAALFLKPILYYISVLLSTQMMSLWDGGKERKRRNPPDFIVCYFLHLMVASGWPLDA